MIKNIFILLLFSSVTIWGQAETLVSGKIEHGGFGAPVVKFIQIDGKFGLLIGGRGGWIMNHKFVIGGGGYGLVNKIETDYMLNGDLIPLMMGYGGFEMEYIFSSNNLVHFSIYLLLGGGGITYKEFHNWDSPHISDSFWIAVPASNIELNISSFFRIAAGVGYRFVTDVNLGDLTNSDIAGFEGTLTFKFGKF
ncbi:hypothetical protein MNBD_IGNAVI01-848 [hydrothermal vent metagenome]|uniref:Outer membrane protein beta-barrel domain-containing protein n=1 Tax=hydrothermal vent metagenome TaxID=652676 RepID=A0A3B1D346_9ZZZZ